MDVMPYELRAYPRLRGEHSARNGVSVRNGGLPPPSRGARHEGRLCRRSCGPTPAFAGSTVSLRAPRGRTRAYPRLRGEHEYGGTDIGQQEGLPPPSRGARHQPRRRLRPHGPTPAFAGSTRAVRRQRIASPALPPPSRGAPLSRAAFTSLSTAYPRLRGEHDRCRSHQPRRAGLPPAFAGSTLRDLRF